MTRPIPIFGFVFAAYYATTKPWEEAGEANPTERDEAAGGDSPQAAPEAANVAGAKPVSHLYICQTTPEATCD